VSEAQAEAARRGLKNVTFTCADAPHLLEEPGSADLILAFWSERAIAAASAWSPATLRAAKEALVPSGTLIARGLRLLEDQQSNPLHDQATFFYGLAFLEETSRTVEGSSQNEGLISSKGAGEEGSLPFWGDESAAEAFKRAGFNELEMHLITAGVDESSASTFFTARTPSGLPAGEGARTSASRAADATVSISAPAPSVRRPLGLPLAQAAPRGGSSALEKIFSWGFRLGGRGKRRGVRAGEVPPEATAPPPSTEDGWRV
jgi:hypothetical protein